MKHLMNDMSDEDKDKIRKQHEGGMKIDNKNFKKMVDKKLGHVDPYKKNE